MNTKSVCVGLPDRQPPDVLDQVVAKLQRGETAGAIILLELFLADEPSTPSRSSTTLAWRSAMRGASTRPSGT